MKENITIVLTDAVNFVSHYMLRQMCEGGVVFCGIYVDYDRRRRFPHGANSSWNYPAV